MGNSMFTGGQRFLLGCVLALLVACSGADRALDSEVNGRAEQASGRLEVAKAPAAERRSDPLEVTDSVWLGDTAVALQRGAPLPAEWERDDSIALRSDSPLALPQIVSILSSQTKIPFRMTGGVGTSEPADATNTDRARASDNNNSAAGGASTNGLILSYEGKLSGLLDLVTSYFNVQWTYVGGAIDISRFETRTFVLDALPGTISVSSPDAPGATGSAAGSATAQPLATASIDIWEDISRIITGMVGEDGSVTISQSSGTVVVTTTRDRMERVAEFVQQENRRLSRQVAISIEMYTVSISDDQKYALNLQPDLQMPGWFGRWLDLSLGGVPINSADIVGGSLSIGLINPPALAGSSAVFQALNTLGKATRVAQIPMTTLNNRPATQRIATDRAYVSETSVTVNGSGTSATTTTEISTDTAVSGISVSVLPRLMDDGRLLLQYALAQGNLVQLRSFASPDGSASVQLPETQGLSFSQQVMMKNGATLVLAGFDQSDIARDDTHPLREFGFMLGGTKSNSSNRQLVVIAITPREIVVSNPEAS